jgi:hypothetical protein
MGKECYRQDEDPPISLHPQASATALPSFAGSKRKPNAFSPRRREEREEDQEIELKIFSWFDSLAFLGVLAVKIEFGFSPSEELPTTVRANTPQAHVSGSNLLSVAMPGNSDAIHHRAWRRCCQADGP